MLRKLAKSAKILNVFSASKEMNGVKLFRNETDFSRIQEIFINYLYFYYGIHQDISAKKVSKKVLDDEVYEDAYAYWKFKSDKSEQKDKPQSNPATSHGIHLVFNKDTKR